MICHLNSERTDDQEKETTETKYTYAVFFKGPTKLAKHEQSRF